ncbi:thioredoxin family protein [Cryptosporidium muris RN66]|uniref:Thioredoxin family protein n=1 Tax=Cryptosporidium muris (strain RN66) TaxID=441375 RepID=B6AA15_CRYMR|nr:thioredoxin family protein [Cryptosporidium muris RN66]EEA05056.1 thioredoxin family protein [Cryptosporidium muris RN66]|eukprot:XP_002139405.1 thioredoxin family protein [Cryptosporidium muris RN66]
MIICLGPLCIPLWHICLFIACIFKPLVKFFNRICLRKTEEKNGEQEINKSNTYRYSELRKKIFSRNIIEMECDADWLACKVVANEIQIPVIIDFYSDWCKPCKDTSQIYQKLSKNFEAIFTKVNVDKFQSLVENETILCLPTFQIWKSYKNKLIKLRTITGAKMGELEAVIKEECKMVNN